MNALETIQHKNFTIEIHQDSDPSNPRDDDNLGTMACFHRRYTLGDKDHGLSIEEVQAIAGRSDVVSLPVFLYDHSGLTVATSPFSCQWDSGQVGRIFITNEEIRKEYGLKRVSRQMQLKVASYLQGEVELYDKYLRGDFYGFVVKDSEGEHIDSCWSFDDKDHCLEEAKGIAEYHAKEDKAIAAMH